MPRSSPGSPPALRGSAYRIAVHLVGDSNDSLDAVRNIVEGHLADGLIFSGILADDPRVTFLIDHGFPFVTLGRNRTARPHAFVDIDSDWAAYAATRRLIDGGHRRIALIDPEPQMAYSFDRLTGYRRALAEAGLPFDASPCRERRSDLPLRPCDGPCAPRRA